MINTRGCKVMPVKTEEELSEHNVRAGIADARVVYMEALAALFVPHPFDLRLCADV